MTREGVTALTYLIHRAFQAPAPADGVALLSMAKDLSEVLGYSEDQYCAILGEVRFNHIHVGSKL